MWKVGLFEVIFSFVGDGFLGLSVNWQGKMMYLVNVYASCFLDKKKEMWNKLRELRNNFQEGEWCVGGDFNAVCDKGERKGERVQMDGGEIQEFNEFISSMEMIDLSVLGNRFTWFNQAGSTCSRLDKFLISEGLVDLWEIDRQVVGERSVSDHCPIWLNGMVKDWGPKPIKLFKCWFNHDGFRPFLEEGWKSLDNIRGKPGFVLKEKLSKLKAMIRKWNKEDFGVVDLEVNSAIDNLNKLDSMVVDVKGVINTDIAEARSVASKSMWDAVNNRESMLK
ncbi:uncharacterized protein LOC131605163 [Vicia villosa]|uniref:uncharacterized protein LOC131605163 n=1 Tax=Vicia villosa TaxID=3911 RepID=UPI00273B5066|nr:uncharacterized protein LOC131605163 [Vicia villosa]